MCCGQAGRTEICPGSGEPLGVGPRERARAGAAAWSGGHRQVVALLRRAHMFITGVRIAPSASREPAKGQM